MKNKIIYIYPNKATFIDSDLTFLSKKYHIITQDLEWGNPKKLPFNLIRQFIFLVCKTYKSKAIIVNFGGYFSLLPTLFGKLFSVKTFLILNGTDCVSFPSYHYGSLRIKPLKFFIKKSLELAHTLLPVDDSLINQIHTFDENVIERKQGVKTFFPSLKTPIQVIPNGFNATFWKIQEDNSRKGFITVGFVNSLKSYRVKGVDLIVETAKKLIPWRKGPFKIFGLEIDSEWQSNIKYNLIRPHFNLKDKVVADIGCNNGYCPSGELVLGQVESAWGLRNFHPDNQEASSSKS